MIKIGNVPIGGGHPVVIQSMTNSLTIDIKKTVRQIEKLQNAGCEIVRLAVPDTESAKAIKEIKKQVSIPLIADIHFDYKLALEAVKAGVDGLRLNPGNIGGEKKVLEVVQAVKERKIPIRIGVNSGSLSKEILRKFGVSARGIVESALQHVAMLEKANYREIKISVKSSSVPLTIESYQLLSSKVDYPLHLGVTEAGTDFSGSIKSAVGIGALLAQGIGDTIRVSLTSDPVNEIAVARQILQALELKSGLEIISCPTCGRTKIDLINLTKQAEKRLKVFAELPIKVAVMGCVVNGPGEAREADYGIAGGKQEGLIFKKGKILKKVAETELIDQLVHIIKTDLKK
jgi:(E)-4-hydroxy-3-methylbut-2-enyl-diphosphate synthase